MVLVMCGVFCEEWHYCYGARHQRQVQKADTPDANCPSNLCHEFLLRVCCDHQLEFFRDSVCVGPYNRSDLTETGTPLVSESNTGECPVPNSTISCSFSSGTSAL